jgi:magnesium-transporting ATPase (P-type)
MSESEPPPLPLGIPPPLPPGRRPSPLPAPVPVAAPVPQPKVVAPPVSSYPKADIPATPAPGGKLWWVWCLAGGFACLVLFIVCLNCNPVTTATDRLVGKVQAAVAQQIDPQLHPFLAWGVGFLFNKYLALPYAQMQAFGFTFAFFVCLLIPLGGSLFSASLGHPIFMIGGAPGGWRSTWRNYGLHRFICDGATLLVIALALMVPLEPTTAASMLIVLLPMIRVGSMIALWVLLARSHGFGPARVIFLGLPNIFFISLCSGFLAFFLALYLYAYLAARSF